MTDDSAQDTASGPASLLAALVGDMAAQARERALDAMLVAFEHLLRQQSWARDRLKAHAGRTVRIAIDTSLVPVLGAPELRVGIGADGMLQRADPATEADATLLVRPSADALFAFLGEGAQGVQRYLRIDGDVNLASTLGELAQHLRWDVEEDLSRVVGDIAAHRIVGLAGQAFARLRDLGLRAETSAAQFAATGSQVAVKPQVRQLLEAAAALDQQVLSLESRVARLARR